MATGIAVGVALFVGGSLGLILHRLLPEKHVTGSGRTWSARSWASSPCCPLVLGLLIWTAYGVYAGQNTAIQTLAAKVLQLDLALSDYGPGANDARAQLRKDLGKTLDEVWGSKESDANFVANNFVAAIHNLRSRDASLAALHPSTMLRSRRSPRQRRRSNNRTIAIADVLRARRSHFHSAHRDRRRLGDALFFGYGLMSGGGATPFVAVAVGALGVASAAFLILELSSPYSGIFRASSAPLEQVLAVMGKE